jgi:hypothetical protein
VCTVAWIACTGDGSTVQRGRRRRVCVSCWGIECVSSDFNGWRGLGLAYRFDLDLSQPLDLRGGGVIGSGVNRIVTLYHRSDEPDRAPVRPRVDLIGAVHLRSGDQKRLIPFRPGSFVKEPLQKIEINPPSFTAVPCVCGLLPRAPCTL